MGWAFAPCNTGLRPSMVPSFCSRIRQAELPSSVRSSQVKMMSGPSPDETKMKKGTVDSGSKDKHSVFILDDHPMTRHGLRQLINCEPDLVVVGEAGNAQLALVAIKPPLPDLVLADLSMAGKS